MDEARPTAADPARAVAETMRRIYDLGLTTTSGGNISVRDEAGAIRITPGGVDKGELSGRDIVCVQADGSAVGRHPPSSEWPFHAGIYRARPDLNAIVHAHPVALVAFSICRAVPDTTLLAAAHAICGPVGHVPYERSGSGALAERVAGAFAEGFNCVMLENHGVITAGADLRQAFRRFETLEHAAQIIARAGIIGQAIAVSEEYRQRADAAGSEPSGSGPPPAHHLMDDVCRFTRRGCARGLLTSAMGAVSARADDDSLLITGHRADRMDPRVQDIALVRADGSSAGPPPDPLALIHAAIYQRHPSVRAVISAAPIHASVFCITGQPLETRAMAESYVLLRDVARIPAADLLGDPPGIADTVSPQRPAALIAGHGALVLGTTLLETFDRLEVLEATAATLIHSRGIGRAVPLAEDKIRNLADISYAPRESREDV